MRVDCTLFTRLVDLSTRFLLRDGRLPVLAGRDEARMHLTREVEQTAQSDYVTKWNEYETLREGMA
jgi:hypothetical protein